METTKEFVCGSTDQIFWCSTEFSFIHPGGNTPSTVMLKRIQWRTRTPKMWRNYVL